jgi:phospholipase C
VRPPSDPARELAVPLSIAVRIEPELIRAVRLTVLPYLDVAAESDLWFSDLAASRGPESIVLAPEVLPALRAELAGRIAGSTPADPIRTLWDVTARVHARISPALLLEERVAWLAVSEGADGGPAIEEELRAALYSLVVEDRPGLADWLLRAWPRLPDEARNTVTAWRLRQAASRHVDTSGLPLGVVPAGIGVADLAEFAAELRDAPLGVRLAGGELQLGDLPPAAETSALLTLDTDPRIVELLPDQGRPGQTLAVPRGQTLRVPAGSGPVRLRTPRGLVYELTPPRAAPASEETSSLLSEIQHVVVLMLEQRSFDHMLGFLYTSQGNVSPSGQPYDGLTGSESNPGPSGEPVTVFEISPSQPDAYFMPGAAPETGYQATNLQLYGRSAGPASRGEIPSNQGFVRSFAAALESSARESSARAGALASNIMGCFSPYALPVLSGLARGYAVCDQWFASVPAGTLPNRAFACAATSQGRLDGRNHTYTSPSIFSVLGTYGLNWALYGYSSEPLTRNTFSDLRGASAGHTGLFRDFQAAAVAGVLPAFTFLEPSFPARGSNSQAPSNDVARGEQLIFDVYRALRYGPSWNQTLFVITYSSHGGCYDHVPPPRAAVPPDSSVGEFGFDFTRFGVRVPAVLVSPLIAPGTVLRAPAASAPFDHTSILKTVQLRWGQRPLTARDAAAPSLAGVLTLKVPRTDDPLVGIRVPVAASP